MPFLHPIFAGVFITGFLCLPIVCKEILSEAADFETFWNFLEHIL